MWLKYTFFQQKLNHNNAQFVASWPCGYCHQAFWGRIVSVIPAPAIRKSFHWALHSVVLSSQREYLYTISKKCLENIFQWQYQIPISYCTHKRCKEIKYIFWQPCTCYFFELPVSPLAVSSNFLESLENPFRFHLRINHISFK